MSTTSVILLSFLWLLSIFAAWCVGVRNACKHSRVVLFHVVRSLEAGDSGYVIRTLRKLLGLGEK